MGATLPHPGAALRAARPWELRRVGLRIGTLYAVNLFGAVAGSFFAGFVFLPDASACAGPTSRRRRSTCTLAAGDPARAALLPAAPRRGTRWTSCSTRPPRRRTSRGQAYLPPEPAIDARSRRASLWRLRVSGATAMTLQVLWTRALAVLHRLVDLLVHAHPAGVPDRPRRRRRRCSGGSRSGRRTRSAGWRCCTWGSRSPSAPPTSSPTSCRSSSPGCLQVDRASASTRS